MFRALSSQSYLTVLFVALAGGCSDAANPPDDPAGAVNDDSDVPPPNVHNPAASGTGADGTPADPFAACEVAKVGKGVRIWSDTSRTIQGSWFAFFAGGYRLQLVLSTLGCLSARLNDGRTLATAKTLRPGSGCAHGLFNESRGLRSWWFLVDVPSPGVQHFRVGSCGDRALTLTLYDQSGDSELTRVNSQGGTCPDLAYDFDQAQIHALQIELTGGTQAGDFFLAVQPW